MNVDEVKASLRSVEERLETMAHELADLRGAPCQKCSRRDGDTIVGRPGDLVVLVGGYEAILCRACRNAWAVAADESGHWLDYRKGVATAKAARDMVKAGAKAGQWTRMPEALESAVNVSVESLVAVERKLFQLAMKWIAEGTP